MTKCGLLEDALCVWLTLGLQGQEGMGSGAPKWASCFLWVYFQSLDCCASSFVTCVNYFHCKIALAWRS